MDKVRLYEMYLTEAIEERKTDLLNRNKRWKCISCLFKKRSSKDVKTF